MWGVHVVIDAMNPEIRVSMVVGIDDDYVGLCEDSEGKGYKRAQENDASPYGDKECE
jgi:hypothetical protein